MKLKVFDYLGDGSEMLEDSSFEKLSKTEEKVASMHKGFWSLMDTLKEQVYLEHLCKADRALWMVRKR